MIDVFKSSGPGGQHKNKRFTAVRLVHRPTGIVVVAQKRRSLAANKAEAWARLEERLRDFYRPRKARLATRQSRSSKERTLAWKKQHGKKKALRRQKISGEE